MASVTSAARYITSASCYHPRYQSRSSMCIRGLIPRNFAELAEAVPIVARAYFDGFQIVAVSFIADFSSDFVVLFLT